ncbi:MAG: hypothetical protein LBD48_06795 [Treponema sp.]|jgi:hypothetical protein|nr:hypothetical protein [Treponema sp.]
MKQKFPKRAAVLPLLIAALAACDNPAEGSNNNQQAETLRYQTVPVVTQDNKSYSLVTAAYDNDYYYYIYLLGKVDRVPIVYGEAFQYDGVTPISIAYEKNSCNEESVIESMTVATENSVTNTTSYNVGTSLTVGANAGIYSASLTASFNYGTGKEEMQGRSTANTYETARTKVQGESNTISYTIGSNNQPPGKYRTSLFGTTDVYYQLVTTKDRVFTRAFTFSCARPADTLYWGIDYDPDLSGDFSKTAETRNLVIPHLNLNDLPEPTTQLTADTSPEPPTPAKVVWTASRDNQVVVTDSKPSYDSFTLDFDLPRLKSEGYTSFTINMKFWVQEINDGWVNVYVFRAFYSGSNSLDFLTNKLVGSSVDTIDLSNTNWTEQSLEFSIPINLFQNELSFFYDASGSGSDDYYLAGRIYTVTAKK